MMKMTEGFYVVFQYKDNVPGCAGGRYIVSVRSWTQVYEALDASEKTLPVNVFPDSESAIRACFKANTLDILMNVAFHEANKRKDSRVREGVLAKELVNMSVVLRRRP